jgi:WD40 repeat protein
MKLACRFLFLLFAVVQSNGLGFSLDSYHIQRGFILTCSISGCQTAISNCIFSFKCLGIDQCKRCLNSYQECNNTCANDLFNEQDYVIVNGAKYLPCDDTSAEQVKACELHCRGYFFRYSECTLLDGFPICRCSSFPYSSTSSSSTSRLGTTVTSSATSTLATTTTATATSFWSSITLNGHTSDINAVVVLKNGDLSSADDSGIIIIWDSITYQLKRNLTGHTGYTLCLTVLPNGDLVSGSTDQTIKIWDIVTGTIKKTLTGYFNTIYSLAVINSGNLASATGDGLVTIRDPSSGSLIRTLTGYSNVVLFIH